MERTTSPVFLCFCQFALQEGKARAIMAPPALSTGSRAVLSCKVPATAFWGDKGEGGVL